MEIHYAQLFSFCSVALLFPINFIYDL